MQKQHRRPSKLDTSGADAESLLAQLERVVPQSPEEIAGQPALPPQLRLSLARLSIAEIVGLAVLLALMCLAIIYLALRFAAPPVASRTLPSATSPAAASLLSEKLLWSFDSRARNVSVATCAEDGSLFVTLDQRELLALASDGTQRFRFKLGGDAKLGPPAACGVAGAVVGTSDGRVIRVNGWGETDWTFNAHSEVAGQPLVFPKIGVVYVSCIDGDVYCLWPTGSPYWHCTTRFRFRSTGPAVTQHGRVYDVATDGTLVAIDNEGKLLWSKGYHLDDDTPLTVTADGGVLSGAGDVIVKWDPDGQELWRFRPWVDITAAPGVSAEGNIYTGNINGQVFALRADGKQLWSAQVPGAITVRPLVAPDGRLCVAAENGKLYSFDSAGRRLYELDLQTPARSLLLTAQGTVYYAGQNGVLYALKG